MFKWMSGSIKEKNDNAEEGCFGGLEMPSPIREVISDVITAPRDRAEPMDIPERPKSRRS